MRLLEMPVFLGNPNSVDQGDFASPHPVLILEGWGLEEERFLSLFASCLASFSLLPSHLLP